MGCCRGQQLNPAHVAGLQGLPLTFKQRLGHSVEEFINRLAIIDRLVAQQHHVAARVKRDHRRLGVADLLAVNQTGTGHTEIVAENRAAKAKLTTQDVG